MPRGPRHTEAARVYCEISISYRLGTERAFAAPALPRIGANGVILKLLFRLGARELFVLSLVDAPNGIGFVQRLRVQLYYDGYDPAWIIGTGKPPPAQTIVTNKPVLAATPLVPVQANGIVPQVQLPHAHPYPQGPGTGKPKPQAHPLAGKGTPVPLVQSHGQKIGKSNLAPVPQSHVHVSGVGTAKSINPYPQGVAGSNPNPYMVIDEQEVHIKRTLHEIWNRLQMFIRPESSPMQRRSATWRRSKRARAQQSFESTINENY